VTNGNHRKTKIRKIRVPRIQPNDEEWELGQALATSTLGRIGSILDQLDARLWEEDYIEELLDIEESLDREEAWDARD